MKNALEVNLDLVKKYNVPAPRYTSYPTALQFRDAVADSAVFEVMRKDIADGGNVISVYIHHFAGTAVARPFPRATMRRQSVTWISSKRKSSSGKSNSHPTGKHSPSPSCTSAAEHPVP